MDSGTQMPLQAMQLTAAGKSASSVNSLNQCLRGHMKQVAGHVLQPVRAWHAVAAQEPRTSADT